MGLLVSSDVLSNSLRHTLTVEAPLAVLPTWSPLQQHVALQVRVSVVVVVVCGEGVPRASLTPLASLTRCCDTHLHTTPVLPPRPTHTQVGLRTGLCGSLTTFASWLTQMVIMLVGGLPGSTLQHSQWVEALGGLLVGTLAAVAALVMGQHMALLAYHKLNPGAFIPFGSPAPEQRKLEEDSRQPAAAAEEEQATGWGSGSLQEQQQQRRLSSSSSMGGLSLGRLRMVSTTQEGRATVVVVQECSGKQEAAVRHPSHLQQQGQGHTAGADPQSLSSLKQQPPRGSLELAELQQQQQQQQDGSSPGLYVSSAAALAHQHSQPDGDLLIPVTRVSEVDEVAEPTTSPSQLLADGFAVVTIVVLTSARNLPGISQSLPACTWLGWACP
jgi:fluoride ion exporter CrcB/FEX